MRDFKPDEFRAKNFLLKLAEARIQGNGFALFRTLTPETQYTVLEDLAKSLPDPELAASLNIWRKLELAASRTKKQI